MKKINCLRSVLFTVTLAVTMLGCVLARLVYPMVILPQWNIPNLAALSALVLVLEHYIGGQEKQNYLTLLVFSCLSCALLPWATGWIVPGQMPLYGISGGLTFTATAWLFDSLRERLSSGPAAKAAPALGALGIWLAAQALQGILL